MPISQDGITPGAPRANIIDVLQVAEKLHRAGFLQGAALERIDRFGRSHKIHYSAETGSGASTLLLSNLSDHHTVFAVEDGNGSITNVQGSPLLRSECVEFVEGPSQVTVPKYKFEHPLQLVLLDGPHAWPFPDLEYYYFYSQIEEGGLLAIDNVEIPTVRKMFDILRADAMWKLDEVILNTAFFYRTSAPAFRRTCDDWELQGFNRAYPLPSIDGRPGETFDAAKSGTETCPETTQEDIQGLRTRLAAAEAEVRRVHASATWRWTQGLLNAPIVRTVFGEKIDAVARRSSTSPDKP